MPADVRAVAEAHALRIQRQAFPGTITAAFWSEGARLAAAEPWPPVYEHGAHLIRIQLLDMETALPEWRDNFGFSSRQMAVVRSLYERRLAAPD